MTHVRLVFPDVHEISFPEESQRFVFLRELEIQGTLPNESVASAEAVTQANSRIHQN